MAASWLPFDERGPRPPIGSATEKSPRPLDST